MWMSPWLAPGGGRDVWDEFDQLRAGVDRLLRNHWTEGEAPAGSAMNVWSGDEDIVVTMLAPGLGPEQIEIAVEGQELIIGARPAEEPQEERRWLLRERRRPRFARRLRLPYQVDTGKIEATVRNGVLRVVAPRAEEDKPRRIKVQGA